MAETIRGGAYLDPDGKTWHNAAGEPIDAPDAKQLAKAKESDHNRRGALAAEEAASAQARGQLVLVDPRFLNTAPVAPARPTGADDTGTNTDGNTDTGANLPDGSNTGELVDQTENRAQEKTGKTGKG